MEKVMESWIRLMPLHLKIATWHSNLAREGIDDCIVMPLEVSELETVPMPRQWLPNMLDPSGELTVPEVRDKLVPVPHYSRQGISLYDHQGGDE